MQESFSNKLNTIWQKTNSYLCVGLDPDVRRVPKHLTTLKNPVFEFNKQIIEATHDMVCSYKPQLAYYSGQGLEDQLHLTLEFLRSHCAHIPVVLDAKRGDIGSTAEMYAREAFEVYKADAVTVNPYMGLETVEPFLVDKNKGVFVLCKTSNLGSGQYQNLKTVEGATLFELVAKHVHERGVKQSGIGLVVGATHIEDLKSVRAIAPNAWLLVPGVGEQGGSVEEVVRHGRAKSGHGLLINSSRGIIYAGNEKDFAQKAREAAKKIVQQVAKAISE